jgi:4-amino-4-deoxy-L-arabinose transferase-like glycosyltransferase
MLAAQLGLTLLLLGVCSFVPGFMVVRRLPWNPLEKLCGSIALSLTVLYLVCFGSYCFAPGSLTAVCRAFAAASVLLGLLAWKDINRLARSHGARQALQGYGFLLAWTLAILSMIRNYSGALWAGDWAEHFQRTLFFLHRFPTRVPIVGDYKLPARPPMMNVLGAFFLAQTADRYEIFQLVFAFLNLLLFLACCLMMRALVKKRSARILPLVALFAMNPMLMENAAYTWTKELTAFFVALALWLYLAGLRKDDGVRMAAAFVALAAGLLVHYSAGPYIAFLALHYVIRVFPQRPNRLREIAVIGGACGLLLATWFGWSMAVYGIQDTFASNTSITSGAQYRGSTLVKIGGNLLDTAVPGIFRNPDALSMFDQANTAGKLRDNFFAIYQTNLIFGMGLIGGPFAFWLFCRAMQRRPARGRESRFWLYLAPFVIVTGIAVVGERDSVGVAHLTLIAIEALGITLIAASFPWRRRTAVFLIAGCVVDFSLGVFLQARVESFDNTPQKTVFEGFNLVGKDLQLGAIGPDSLSEAAWRNWHMKNQEALDGEWLRRDRQLPQNSAVVQRYANLFEQDLKSNAQVWQGWYARNGGAMTFLGDRLAWPSASGWNAPSLAMLLLFAGLLGVLWKHSMRLAPAEARKPTAGLNKPAPRKPVPRQRR